MSIVNIIMQTTLAQAQTRGEVWPDWAVWCTVTENHCKGLGKLGTHVNFFPSKIAMLRAVVKTRRWKRDIADERRAVVSYYEWDWGPVYRGTYSF